MKRLGWSCAVALLAACSADAGGEGAVAVDAGSRVDTGRPQADVPRLDAARDVLLGPDVRPVDTGVRVDTGASDAASDAARDAGPPDSGPPRCGAGIDSDNDGLTNDEECRLMTDPFVADSDSDGIRDGDEARYPRACVASDVMRQRRPPTRCTSTTMCMAGEVCSGLDPTRRDSDGDGVDDGLEDTNGDGTIDTARGETDPRLRDTDGDGRPDNMGGLEICRPSGLASVSQLGLPGAPTQIGFDPAWGMGRRVPGTMMRGGVVFEDARNQVAGAVFNQPSMGDLRAEAMRVETAIVAALGAGTTPVLIGRGFTTHDSNSAVTSTYRVARTTTASALRDAVAMALTGMAPPAGAALGSTGEFFVDVTTVRRTVGRSMNTTDVAVAVAPRAAYETTTALTAIRSIDLVNATGIAENDQGLGAACQVFRADRVPMADFLWTVDTSGSMSDDQERLGRTAVQFFQRLRAAGVDFRVGVLNAGSTTLNLDSPGFAWINGADANGPQRLCQEATYNACPTVPGDTLRPYAFGGSSEEPTAAAVIATNEMFTRAARGETNPNRRFRQGARVVTFHVTDEPGSNDFSRYFARTSDPQNMRAWGTSYSAATRNNIVDYFRRNMILTFGLVPYDRMAASGAATMVDCNNATTGLQYLPRCVIEGNNGAVIPIVTATDAEITAAMTRIVEAIAGATSPFVLERTPITSTLKVRVRGVDVPRSRANGFDYDATSRAVLFYGDTYRPRIGDEVVVSYRLWRPCTQTSATCRSDADCCAPQTCQNGACQAPCRATGAMCTSDRDCCSPNSCQNGVCTPAPMCIARGQTCVPSELRNDCCTPYVCVNGRCDQCLAQNNTCARNNECCSGVCTAGRCSCVPTTGRCTTPADCCSNYCVDGFCGPG
ncbi:MAG: hypothetical protein JNK72_16025 [Myxococcales bacterium]|nr:hypothetical protein [Myxococcales bacterium]